MLIKLLQKFSEEKQSRGERLTIPEAILLAQFVDWAEREAAEHSVHRMGLLARIGQWFGTIAHR